MPKALRASNIDCVTVMDMILSKLSGAIMDMIMNGGIRNKIIPDISRMNVNFQITHTSA